MKLIEQWWKPWSVWLLVAANTLVGVSMFLPEIQQAIPENWYKFALVAIFIARVIQQGKKDASNP